MSLGDPQNFTGYMQSAPYELGGSLTSGNITITDGSSFEPALPVTHDPNKAREITIRSLNFGYIVTVGCHEFAFETHEKLAKKLGEYLADPAKVEKEWFENRTL